MTQVQQLFYRYLKNECSPEEIKTLLRHFGEQEDNVDLKSLILEQLNEDIPEDFEQQPQVIAAFRQTDQYLQDTIFKKKVKFPFFQLRSFRYAAAASIAIVLLGSVYFLNLNSKEQAPVQQTNLINDAQPGTDKAILTLADGSTISLDAKGDNTVLNQKGIRISKTKEGMLIYEVLPSETGVPVSGFNELKTPRAAQYQVLLPDGTRVWLNSSSSLRYPLVFSDHERRVTLTGEGYFEVEKVNKNGRSLPFFVETESQVVQVLGTEFNISAYQDDQVVKTTLISGKVNVIGREGSNSQILKPGEQSILTPDNEFQVLNVNAENSRAWKNGNFLFEDVYLKEILRHFSRWYDVEVDYSEIPNTRYNILIARNEPLSSVLRMLEKTGNIKFQQINNTIKINH